MLTICIKNGLVRYAQADGDGRPFVVNHLGHRPLPHGLDSPDPNSPELPGQLDELFGAISTALSTPENKVFLSLGGEWAECLLIELDPHLSVAENEDYLNWVVRQRKGDLWEDTIAFFQRIQDGEGDVMQVLACLASERLVESIRSSLEAAGMPPTWMEPAVQSVGRVVTAEEGGTALNTVVLEPDDGPFKAQLYQEGKLKALAEIGFRSGKFSSRFVKGDSSFAGTCISRLNEWVETGKSQADFHLFMVGEFSERQLKIVNRTEGSPDPLTLVDPLSRMTGDQTDRFSSSRGSWFVELLGLLLLEAS